MLNQKNVYKFFSENLFGNKIFNERTSNESIQEVLSNNQNKPVKETMFGQSFFDNANKLYKTLVAVELCF